MMRFGICNRLKDGTLTWFTADGRFLEDKVGSYVKVWHDPQIAAHQLYLMHAAQVPNAYVAVFPSGKRVLDIGHST